MSPALLDVTPLARFRFTPDQRAALVAPDQKAIVAIVAIGAYPLLPLLARMQVNRSGR